MRVCVKPPIDINAAYPACAAAFNAVFPAHATRAAHTFLHPCPSASMPMLMPKGMMMPITTSARIHRMRKP